MTEEFSVEVEVELYRWHLRVILARDCFVDGNMSFRSRDDDGNPERESRCFDELRLAAYSSRSKQISVDRFRQIGDRRDGAAVF